MKKSLFTAIFAVAAAISAQAQVPNGGFEYWTTTTKDVFSIWNNFGNVTKYTPAQQGSSAVRLQQGTAGTDEPGAILLGNPPTDNGPFTGGVPFAARPDSFTGWFQYSHPSGDSSVILLYLKRNGKDISQNMWKIGGNSSGWTRIAFPVMYQDTGKSDTLIMGIASTDFTDTLHFSSWLAADNLAFSGTVLSIPNGNCEYWTTKSLTTPNGWAGSLSYNSPTTSLVRSTDAAGGTYAIRLDNSLAGGGAYATTMNAGGGFKPSFPINIKPDTLYCYAKWLPQNNDTAVIQVSLWDSGDLIGVGETKLTAAVNAYSLFKLPVGYFGQPGRTPDSATIILAGFNFTGGYGTPRAYGNSSLTVDEIGFNMPWPLAIQNLNTPGFTVYPNPVSGTLYIGGLLNAGEPIAIFASDGKLVKQIKAESETNGITSLRTDDLPNGLYLIKTATGGCIRVAVQH